MSAHLLLEAAVRSLVMGAMILAALRLLRIDQVRARRTAWLLALIGALAMPVLVGAQIGPPLLPDLAAPAQPRPQTALRHVEQNSATLRRRLPNRRPRCRDRESAPRKPQTARPVRLRLVASAAISLAVIAVYCIGGRRVVAASLHRCRLGAAFAQPGGAPPIFIRPAVGRPYEFANRQPRNRGLERVAARQLHGLG